MIMWNGKERTLWWMVKKQLVDQPLHAMWGAISQLPLLLFIGKHQAEPLWLIVLGAALGAFLMAQPRELYEQWPISHWWDYVLDCAFFAIGGAAAAWIIVGVL